ncbi:MAG: O-antigen ligase family protein [Pseudomonadota bacterium]|nr:O-antigen ligase family protein [Pseudomonadota bacterium]
MTDKIMLLSSTEYRGPIRLLFSLIAVTFVLYVYRNVITVNVEFVLGLILFLSAFVLYKIKCQVPLSIWGWTGLLVLYWLTTLVATFAHESPEKRALFVLSVASLSWVFIGLTIALYKLKPGLDFFWYLMLIGGSVALSLGILDAYEFGWFNSGLGSQRLGDINSHPVKYAVVVNGFFIILLGSLPWALKKSKWLLGFIALLIVALFLTAILTKSRTAWIGWPEALVGWGIYYFVLFKDSFPKIKYPKISFIILIGIVVLSLTQVDFIKKRIADRSLLAVQEVNIYLDRQSMNSSLGHRLLSYEIAVQKIPEIVWFGIGEDAFPEFLKLESKRFAKEYFNQDISGFKYSQLHNQFLMSFLTKGVFVFASVLVFFVFLIVFFVRRMRIVSKEVKPIAIAGLIFSISSFLAFLPETPLQNTDMSTHFFLLCSMLIAFSIIEQKNQNISVDVSTNG